MTPESANLLKAFLTALYTDEYTEICASEFGFVPVTGEMRDKALAQIDALNTGGGIPWSFELKTDKGPGQSDYVFSVKRDSYSEIEQDALVSQLAALQQKVDAMSDGSSYHDHEEESERDQELTAALALGAASFALWVFALICFLVKYVLHM